jgi:hypothetical protein
MPNITIKDIPTNVYRKLKRMAELHRRSINSEVIHCIERAVSSQPIDPEAFLVRARALRVWTEAYPVTDQDFTQAKAAGRP